MVRLSVDVERMACGDGLKIASLGFSGHFSSVYADSPLRRRASSPFDPAAGSRDLCAPRDQAFACTMAPPLLVMWNEVQHACV